MTTSCLVQRQKLSPVPRITFGNGYSRAPSGWTEATMKIELFMVLVMLSGLVGAFVFWLS
jgi:hypothetical protein